MIFKNRLSGAEGEKGAALVEFAVLFPLLLLIVLGIIDFGFALAQNLDVRHGARETSRLIAVNNFDINVACQRMDLASGATITLTGSGNGVGGTANVSVSAPLNTATGFFDGWLPNTLTSDVSVRMEQPPDGWILLEGLGQLCP